MKREQDRQNSGEKKNDADQKRSEERKDKTAADPTVSPEKSDAVGHASPPVVPVPEILVSSTAK